MSSGSPITWRRRRKSPKERRPGHPGPRGPPAGHRHRAADPKSGSGTCREHQDAKNLTKGKTFDRREPCRLNKIKRVLISVTDKAGIVEFAQGLADFNVEILSTGGTAAQLRKSGLKVTDVSDYTGFPEMMDGRLKTLHPKIHGGLLALRDNAEHMKALRDHGIGLIDMVVVNLYQFEKTVEKEGCTLETAIENIDIGGPTMLRAAAKNYPFVSVVTDPADYDAILKEMKETGGKISEETNFRLAVKTFQLTARYDGAISNYLGKLGPDGTGEASFPGHLHRSIHTGPGSPLR